MRLLDGAPVVVPPVLGSEEAAAAQAGHAQAMRVDGFHSFLQTHLRDLVAPGRDAADLMARAALDHLSEVPLLLHRRGVERKLHFSSSGAISFGRISGISGQMMIAGMASRKQPTTRNTKAMKKPTPVIPIPQPVTFSSSAFGIW